jgi:CBS domain containing-hemolysin-like protein
LQTKEPWRETALDLATHPDRFLATSQIGITLIAILI